MVDGKSHVRGMAAWLPGFHDGEHNSYFMLARVLVLANTREQEFSVLMDK